MIKSEIDYQYLKKQFLGGQYEFCFDYVEFYKFIASKKYKLMVELGNYYGWSSCFLCNERKKYDNNYTLYAVDLHDLPLTDESKGNGYAEVEFMRKRQFNLFQENVKKHQLESNIVTVKNCSWLAAKEFEDNILDFVFIDADHKYESVKKDIEAWYPKLKIGGIISGHDFNSDFGVKDAVEEFFKNNYQIWKEGKSYVWYTTKI